MEGVRLGVRPQRLSFDGKKGVAQTTDSRSGPVSQFRRNRDVGRQMGGFAVRDVYNTITVLFCSDRCLPRWLLVSLCEASDSPPMTTKTTTQTIGLTRAGAYNPLPHKELAHTLTHKHVHNRMRTSKRKTGCLLLAAGSVSGTTRVRTLTLMLCACICVCFVFEQSLHICYM